MVPEPSVLRWPSKPWNSTKRPVAGSYSPAVPSARCAAWAWSTGEIGSGFYMEGRASRICPMATWTGQPVTYRACIRPWIPLGLGSNCLFGDVRPRADAAGLVRCAVGLDAPADSIWAWAANSYEYGYGADSARIEDLIARVASTTTTTTPIRWTITAKITIRSTRASAGQAGTWEPRCTTRRERAITSSTEKGTTLPSTGERR